MTDRKVAIAVVAAGTAGLLMFYFMKRAAAEAKVQTLMVVTKVPPSSVYPGEEFPFSGYLRDIEGNRLAGKRVDLFVNDVPVLYCITNSFGEWDFSGHMAKDTPGTYRIYAKFSGDEIYAGC